MKEDRQEKLKISNDLLDAMLAGVKTQDDLCRMKTKRILGSDESSPKLVWIAVSKCVS